MKKKVDEVGIRSSPYSHGVADHGWSSAEKISALQPNKPEGRASYSAFKPSRAATAGGDFFNPKQTQLDPDSLDNHESESMCCNRHAGTGQQHRDTGSLELSKTGYRRRLGTTRVRRRAGEILVGLCSGFKVERRDHKSMPRTVTLKRSVQVQRRYRVTARHEIHASLTEPTLPKG